MSPSWKVTPPKGDAEYFERMSKAIFTAGLNWGMVEKKWPNFRKAFDGFSPDKVGRFSEARVKTLMGDQGIVRNERKIRATVENARAVVALKGEFGSVEKYIDSFGRKEGELQADLQERFKHLGPSTARMYLWSIGYKLTPTKEESRWLKGHHDES